ncbi:MAG: bifunctional hydroxymethylpyrimidine kinase/phosphomethylpyrimidine kinase [Mariprofundaceae bacterium]|nr:bifunctional hydroxymethylpyrimidine kinase/phosphomethylpyrimidine kinase [Mariprofundaceae bacterium]
MGGINRPAVCLTIGGSDSCGGAGIQADLRMFDRIGVRGCSAITALTAQSPAMIARIEVVSIAQLAAEISSVFNFFDVKVVKTGMLVDAGHVDCVATALQQYHDARPLIVDPVMVASSGRRLLDEQAFDVLRHTLLPQATLITPNLNEAAVLSGGHLYADDGAEMAASLALQYRTAVLVKGGHGHGPRLHDFLCDSHGEMHLFSHPTQAWNQDQAHGTGCRLAAAIAAFMMKKSELPQACRQAIHSLLKNGN